MSCGTLLRTRVRFSPPPPVGRSAGWLAREREAVEHQLERGIVAARGLFDLVGVGLVLENGDHRAAGRPGGGDHDLVGGDAVDAVACRGGGAFGSLPHPDRKVAASKLSSTPLMRALATGEAYRKRCRSKRQT